MSDDFSPSERLKRIHDMEMTRRRVMRLHLRELRNLTMTAAERWEHYRIQIEDQADRDEARWGNASRDGMK